MVFAYNAVDHFIMYPEFRLCVLELVADRFEAYYAASQLRRRSPDPFDLEALLREHFVHHNVTLIRP